MSNSPRVAIIDDDEHLRDALANLVRSAGFDAVTFPSAEAFLERERSVAVDVILTDYQMPGLDGIELIGRLRALGDETPAIVMSAHRYPLLSDRAVSAGAADFILKPFDAELLLETIERAVTGRRRTTNGSG